MPAIGTPIYQVTKPFFTVPSADMSVPEAAASTYERVENAYPIVDELRRKLLEGRQIIRYISPITWDAIREVLVTDHPYGYQAVLQILRILQIRKLLFHLQDGRVLDGLVMQNCPPDLRQALLNIFVDERLF
jgi:hypothetical protein